MDVLTVKNLSKTYPAFKLDDISFSLEEGKITGFIGRNGAGKTTTLRSLFDFIHADCGSVEFFGKKFRGNENEIKKKVGFVTGGVDFYKMVKLKTISSVTKSFYDNWDDNAYAKYMKYFKLDENKSPNQLSEGMKVKYSLALALSHRAELLILDEPTSGLDPVSRDELLDIFMGLSEKGVTILFSTHITSDLDKCADNIIYIKEGKIFAEADIESFVNSYKVVKIEDENSAAKLKDKFIGLKKAKKFKTALMKTEDAEKSGLPYENADLENIMIHTSKEDEIDV